MSEYIKRGSKRNFFMVDNSIFEMNLGPIEQLVYICLLRYADNTTREAFPGQQRIANDCNLGRQRINEAIRVLVEAGLVEKQHRYDITGSQKSNLYIVYDANEVINRVSPRTTGGVAQDDRGCRPGRQEGVAQDDTKNTHLKILSEEEALISTGKEVTPNFKEQIGKIKEQLEK